MQLCGSVHLTFTYTRTLHINQMNKLNETVVDDQQWSEMRERLNRCINVLNSGVRDPSSELSRADMFSIVPVNNSSNCSVSLFAGPPPLFLQKSFLSLFVYFSTKQLDLNQHCKSELKRFFPY